MSIRVLLARAGGVLLCALSPFVLSAQDPSIAGSPSIQKVRPGANQAFTATAAKIVQVSAAVSVSVTPAKATLRGGASQKFSAKVTNSTNQAVAWQVNGTAGGNSQVGLIAANGTYTAPAFPPTGVPVSVMAVSVADPTATGTAAVTLLNPVPRLATVTPSNLVVGANTLTLSGSAFAAGAKVQVGPSVLSVVSQTQTSIVASGNVGAQLGGMGTVTVENPDPGDSISAPQFVPVAPASPQMTYDAAARFLEQASWGPTPDGIAHLQQIGVDAWLAEQFATPPSPYPPLIAEDTSVAPAQRAFFVNAMTGSDQLRQRVAFALSQILVVSGVKTPYNYQLVPYMQLLANDAFGNYRDLMRDATLDPSMGRFLDMVDNDKADPALNTLPNENYARELMQLFTIGLVQLNQDGTPVLRSGQPAPTYTQTDITNLARAFTGWTYATRPEEIGLPHNPPYYELPMMSYEPNHDEGVKTVLGVALAGPHTAESDLDAALDVIYRYPDPAAPNVAPFVARRLIQSLVTSNPSATYVADVSAAFMTPDASGRPGSLRNAIAAILKNPEALAAPSGDSPQAQGVRAAGHLREPILYTISALRSTGATVAVNNGLAALGAGMSEQLWFAPSVFNYFSPLFQIGPNTVAPEFQILSPSTALNRANFASTLAYNRFGSTVQVDLASWSALAADQNVLLDAISHQLMHGQMSSMMRTQIQQALGAIPSGSQQNLQRAETALYLVLSSSQYQVQK